MGAILVILPVKTHSQSTRLPPGPSWGWQRSRAVKGSGSIPPRRRGKEHPQSLHTSLGVLYKRGGMGNRGDLGAFVFYLPRAKKRYN